MSNELKVTPGEWEENPVETAEFDVGIMSPLIRDGVVKKHGFHFKRICRLDYQSYTDEGKEETRANCRLIASAPDLYNALAEMYEFFAENVGFTDKNRSSFAGKFSYEPAYNALKKANPDFKI